MKLTYVLNLVNEDEYNAKADTGRPYYGTDTVSMRKFILANPNYKKLLGGHDGKPDLIPIGAPERGVQAYEITFDGEGAKGKMTYALVDQATGKINKVINKEEADAIKNVSIKAKLPQETWQERQRKMDSLKGTLAKHRGPVATNLATGNKTTVGL